MYILVTGGSGNIGQGVTSWLAGKGHTVRVIDWRLGDQRLAGVEYRQIDITRFDDLREAVRGMEGIVHLAGYPDANSTHGPEMYRVNCWGSFNLFEAAAREGIRQVTVASSINALGYNYGIKDFPIRYFPIDEEHPGFTSDPYSFSKQEIEAIAAYYWRREGISSTCLRMPFVVSFDERFAWASEMMAVQLQALRDLLSFPAEKQRDWLEQIHSRTAQDRQNRESEKPWEGFGGGEPDPVFLAGFGYTDFWSILAIEDAAQAFEKSLLAEFEGSHPLYVTQRDNANGLESEALLKLFYPQVTERRRLIPGAATLVSYQRAANLIGYQPQVVVQDRLAAA